VMASFLTEPHMARDKVSNIGGSLLVFLPSSKASRIYSWGATLMALILIASQTISEHNSWIKFLPS
jgi:hypothetical protein